MRFGMISTSKAGIWALALLVGVVALPARAANDPNAGDDDPYLWLSDIHGAKAVDWAAQQTATSDGILKSAPFYAVAHDAILKSLDVRDRIPLIRLDHGEAYNFWQDPDHVRGIWRRTSIADYRTAQPHWQTLIDLDALDAAEHVPYVWQGADCGPGDHCLVRLSPDGGDASIIREFDLTSKQFVENGFTLPRAKQVAAWLDADSVIFGTDFGPGSLTKSGYPRVLKIWHRGQPITDAKLVYEGKTDDINVRPHVFRGPYGFIAMIERGLTFFTNAYDYLKPDGSTVTLPVPEGAVLHGVTGGQMIFSLRNDWNGFAQGALISFDLVPFVRDGAQHFALLYTPDKTSTLSNVESGRDAVYAAIFENVVGTIHRFTRDQSGRWKDQKLALPGGGSTRVAATDDWGPDALFTYESYVKPPTLYATDGKSAPRPIKAQSPVFDASQIAADQFWATSNDGTKVPYYLIHRKDRQGPAPTILYAYGGFENSLFPIYWNDGHRPLAPWAWVDRGGALAIANIRGGAEFGPAWHEAALKEHRQRAFDDFAAVAKDMQTRGITTPKQTGIVAASNGGVLTTVTMTQHPELLGAVVSQRPLVDMLRYTRFGAGASWVAEYGDPAVPAERAYLERYSAYQTVRPDVDYPPILFITETSDDRVTPIWARMMAAKMEDQHHDVLFNESTAGGHGPGATNAAQAEMWGLTYAFFSLKLGLK
jgi:prolyl oligopeptidase